MKQFRLVVALILPIISTMVAAEGRDPEKPLFYGVGLCDNPNFQCVKVESGQSWEKMFPVEQERDIVQRVNRSYNSLWTGKVIAVPRQMKGKTLLDFSPFPPQVKSEHEKIIIVDQNKLAWAAYNAEGHLVKWGPIASGSSRCPDSNNSCLTMTGVFRFFSKEGEKCISDVFPIGRGGAKMPYCMYFHKGFAIHGSSDMPGYRASHGCVRIFISDAKWLNDEFVEAMNEAKNRPGTKVVVRPVMQPGKTL